MKLPLSLFVAAALLPLSCLPAMAQHGAAEVRISGELKQWHKVTLTMGGPAASETGDGPNPFLDYRMSVTFSHESGSPRYVVPGYFAADGNAAATSASSGDQWRAHVSPPRTGRWNYEVAFVRGPGAAVDTSSGTQPVAPLHGKVGSFTVRGTDKKGADFRSKGVLEYVGKHHLRFAGSLEYFLKAGADSPETLLAYQDFDGTTTRKVPLKSYAPHVGDWRAGDPVWQQSKGKGLIGALNYLASKGVNSISFLTYGGGGDGDNVWPYVSPDDKLRFDCSKLDQWQIVFDHAQAKGLHLHFKLQEQENDDNRSGSKAERGKVPASLDDGALGVERKLYLRELIARFGYAPALNWNLGEENTQSAEEQRAMAQYIRDTDPYRHNIVVHTFPNWQDRVYPALLGSQSVLTGASVQNAWDATHQRTLHWIRESARAGKPWVVANDEQGSASLGVPPDPDYQGFNGKDPKGNPVHTLHDIRKRTLWGNLMAGGAGVEYYFGYQLPQNDLLLEDFRSRDKTWDYARIAVQFFHQNKLPFWEMTNVNALIGNPENTNDKFALSNGSELFVIYLPDGGTTEIDLSQARGSFRVQWFNPRTGGRLTGASVQKVSGGSKVSVGKPPSDATDDWVVLLRK
jgi:hypothetical protein